VTTIDSDANNVYVTLSARSMSPSLFIVARANAEGSEAKLLQAGANRVVSPYTMAGRRIAELASRPRVADFIDAALSHGNLSFSLEEVEVDAESPLLGVTVGALHDDGVVTLAILQESGAYEANPPAGRALQAGESLIISGATDVLAAVRARA
jgi:voltage-gated potassium channel